MNKNQKVYFVCIIIIIFLTSIILTKNAGLWAVFSPNSGWDVVDISPEKTVVTTGNSVNIYVDYKARDLESGYNGFMFLYSEVNGVYLNDYGIQVEENHNGREIIPINNLRNGWNKVKVKTALSPFMSISISSCSKECPLYSYKCSNYVREYSQVIFDAMSCDVLQKKIPSSSQYVDGGMLLGAVGYDYLSTMNFPIVEETFDIYIGELPAPDMCNNKFIICWDSFLNWFNSIKWV